MRKLKIALLALFAMVLSLALFACGDGEQIDTIKVNKDPSITLTDADNEKTAKEYLQNNFTFTATYEKAEDREIPASEYKVDWSGVKFGTTGSYSATVTTTKNNKFNASVTISVTIDHHYKPADENGMQVCDVCSAVSQTKTINDKFSIAGWGDGVVLDENNEYVKTDARLDNATSIVARLDKGMSIKLKGEGKSTGTGSTWFYPILGVANIEENGSVIQRNDDWSIYGAMQNKLNAWASNPYPDQNATILSDTDSYDPETADLYRVYVQGPTSSSSDYFIEEGTKSLAVELTWEYREDNVFIMTWNNPTLNRVRTAYVKLPDRQYYNAILHGEQFSATFTEVQIVQKLKLEKVGEPTVKSDIKKILENKYFDASCIDIDVTYAGKTASEKASTGMLTVYGNESEVTALPEDNVEKGGMGYNGEDGTPWVDLTTSGACVKMSSSYKSFKVRVQTGNDWFEKLLSAAEAAKISGAVVKNAVDHGNANDVKIGSTTFIATDLTKLDFVQTSDDKTGIEIAGTAATLTTEQANALTLGSGTGKHYIAFTLYSDGVTPFSGTATITGTKGAVNVATNHLDVVLAVSADVEKVTISGVNGGTDIVVTFGTGAILGYTTTSTLSFTTLKINETKDLVVTYDISGVSGITDINAVAENLELTVNGVSKTIVVKSNKLDLNNKKVQGLEGFEIKSIEWTAGQLKVTYTIPKLDPYNPTSYTLNLVNSKTGVTLASDKIYYEAAVNTGNEVVGGYYVVADGNTLYLVKVIEGTDITNNVSDSLYAMVNAGAQTQEKYKTYTYLQNHDLSYTVNMDGTVVFTNKRLLEGFASGKLTVFGTLNDSEDTDHGAVLVIKLDGSKVGVAKKSAYAFALNNDTNHLSYNTVSAEGVIGAATSYTLTGEKVAINDVDPDDCTAEVTWGYEIGGTDDTTVFYAGLSFTKNEHNWIKAGTENTPATSASEDAFCSRCGAKRYRITVSETTYQWVELEGPQEFEDKEFAWWAGANGVIKGLSGDFAIEYTYTHADGTGDWSNARLQIFDDDGKYITIDLAIPTDARSDVTFDGEPAKVTSEFKIDGQVSTDYLVHGAEGVGEFNGDVTATIIRVGNVLTVTSSWTSKTNKKYECKVVISNVKSNDVTAQIGGFGGAVKNLKAKVGTVTTYGPTTYTLSEFQEWGKPVPRYYTVKNNEKLTLTVEWDNELALNNYTGAVVNFIGVEGKNYFIRGDAAAADSTGVFAWSPAGVTFPNGYSFDLGKGYPLPEGVTMDQVNATKQDGKQVIEITLQDEKLTVTFSFYAKGQTDALVSWTCYIADAPAASYNMELAIDDCNPDVDAAMTTKSITVSKTLL